MPIVFLIYVLTFFQCLSAIIIRHVYSRGENICSSEKASWFKSLYYSSLCMKNLNALDVDDLKIHFKARKSTILNYLQKVQKVNESIIEVYDQGDESV